MYQNKIKSETVINGAFIFVKTTLTVAKCTKSIVPTLPQAIRQTKL